MSCAEVSRITPSSSRGQQKRSSSRRLANRHRPVPSHQMIFTLSALSPGRRKARPRTDRRRLPGPGPSGPPVLSGSLPASSRPAPAPRMGSCRSDRPDHLGESRRGDITPGADRHIANNQLDTTQSLDRHRDKRRLLGEWHQGVDHPERSACRRHAKTCCRFNPCRRATADTFTPGSSASLNTTAFASADQRRRGTSRFGSAHDSSASIT